MPPTLVPQPGARLLLMHDVRARLPQTEQGACAFSERWVREHVAPNRSRVVGGRWCVAESDFDAWHARWVADQLAPEELPTRLRQKRAGGDRAA